MADKRVQEGSTKVREACINIPRHNTAGMYHIIPEFSDQFVKKIVVEFHELRGHDSY